MELSPTQLLPPSWYQSWVLFQSLFFPNQGIERDRRAQAPSNLEEFEVNDLNYEDKLQEDRFLYSNIAFNLAADAGEGSAVLGRHLGGFPTRPRLALCWGCGAAREKAGSKAQHGVGKAKLFQDGQVEKVSPSGLQRSPDAWTRP